MPVSDTEKLATPPESDTEQLISDAEEKSERTATTSSTRSKKSRSSLRKRRSKPPTPLVSDEEKDLSTLPVNDAEKNLEIEISKKYLNQFTFLDIYKSILSDSQKLNASIASYAQNDFSFNQKGQMIVNREQSLMNDVKHRDEFYLKCFKLDKKEYKRKPWLPLQTEIAFYAAFLAAKKEFKENHQDITEQYINLLAIYSLNLLENDGIALETFGNNPLVDQSFIDEIEKKQKKILENYTQKDFTSEQKKAFDDVKSLIEDIRSIYGHIGASSHKKLEQLNEKALVIYTNNMENPEVQYSQLIKLLASEFAKEIKKEGKSFLSKSKDPLSVAIKILEDQKKFHYIRSIAVLLESCRLKDLSGNKILSNPIITACLRTPDAQVVCVPDNDFYNFRIKSLLTAPELKELESFLEEIKKSPAYSLLNEPIEHYLRLWLKERGNFMAREFFHNAH